jgi:hypothetical protein
MEKDFHLFFFLNYRTAIDQAFPDKNQGFTWLTTPAEYHEYFFNNWSLPIQSFFSSPFLSPVAIARKPFTFLTSRFVDDNYNGTTKCNVVQKLDFLPRCRRTSEKKSYKKPNEYGKKALSDHCPRITCGLTSYFNPFFFNFYQPVH